MQNAFFGITVRQDNQAKRKTRSDQINLYHRIFKLKSFFEQKFHYLFSLPSNIIFISIKNGCCFRQIIPISIGIILITLSSNLCELIEEINRKGYSYFNGYLLMKRTQ